MRRTANETGSSNCPDIGWINARPEEELCNARQAGSERDRSTK